MHLTTASQPFQTPVRSLREPVESDDARALVALYDERCRMSAAMARSERPTGAMAQAILEKGDELDAACEAFRRRYYPRRASVFVGLWQVMAASKTRRSVTTVLDLSDDYRREAQK